MPHFEKFKTASPSLNVKADAGRTLSIFTRLLNVSATKA